MRKIWNCDQFNEINLPEIIGKIDPQFSIPNGIRYLDLCIHIPGIGFRIPNNLENYKNTIMMAIQNELLIDSDTLLTHYVYVTLDQKIVKQGKTGRRAGAHSDAFISTENAQLDVTFENSDKVLLETGEISHTYIAYDCFATEFFNAKFPIKNTECNESLKTFDQVANESEIVTYDPYTLLKLDPYVVHRCSIANETKYRTFLKISISKKRYNRTGNSINSEFDYSDWKWIPRNWEERNHPSL